MSGTAMSSSSSTTNTSCTMRGAYAYVQRLVWLIPMSLDGTTTVWDGTAGACSPGPRTTAPVARSTATGIRRRRDMCQGSVAPLHARPSRRSHQVKDPGRIGHCRADVGVTRRWSRIEDVAELRDPLEHVGHRELVEREV